MLFGIGQVSDPAYQARQAARNREYRSALEVTLEQGIAVPFKPRLRWTGQAWELTPPEAPAFDFQAWSETFGKAFVDNLNRNVRERNL
jgi:hypothetical protein